MINLDDLEAALSCEEPSDEETAITFVVSSDAVANIAVGEIVRIFAQIGAPEAVRVVLEGRKEGYLGRNDLKALARLVGKLASPSPNPTGLGIAAGGTLPGRARLRILELRCPEGCRTREGHPFKVFAMIVEGQTCPKCGRQLMVKR